MDLVSAILGLVGGAVSGAFSYFGIDRQARAAETISREREATARAWYETLAEGCLSQERMNEIRAWFGRDVAWEEGDVQRSRLFYNFQAFDRAQKTAIVLAGAGLVGFALYLATREDS